MTKGLTRRLTVLVLPDWVPDAVRHYMLHTEIEVPIRGVARAMGVHASTILRQIRKVEGQRDDPLIDGGIRRLSGDLLTQADRQGLERGEDAPVSLRCEPERQEARERFEAEAARILRRMCETGAVLAAAENMDKAVVVREGPDGDTSRSAVVERDIAQKLALRDWITLSGAPGRITRYRVTAAGRAALKGLLARAENLALGFAESQSPFARDGAPAAGSGHRGAKVTALRGPMAESPLAGLARRRDRDGRHFLTRELVAAGERLREDFEISRMGAGDEVDWDAMMRIAPDDPVRLGGMSEGSSPEAARARVAAALSDLGPGLGDVALRCCCFLEGLELAEKRMGWAARSGKIVLRIALERLRRHYAEQGRLGPRIG